MAERGVLVLLFKAEPATLERAFRFAGPAGTVALLQDAVELLARRDVALAGAPRVVALGPDLAARGIVAPAAAADVIDHGELADLAARHGVCVSLA